MNAVETLRAAADRLDQLATSTSPSPWESPRPNAGLHEVHDSAGNGIATESDFGDLAEADADWIAVLGPQVAPALSGWLRDTARRLRWDTNADGWTADRWEDFLQVHQSYGGPVRFARMVLGEQAGDPS